MGTDEEGRNYLETTIYRHEGFEPEETERRQQATGGDSIENFTDKVTEKELETLKIIAQTPEVYDRRVRNGKSGKRLLGGMGQSHDGEVEEMV